jgi:hypothetical protein
MFPSIIRVRANAGPLQVRGLSPTRGWLYSFIALILYAGETVPSEASTLATPDCTVSGLTHTFADLAPAGPTTSITDSAAAGQFHQSGFTNQLTGTELVTSRFEADPGKKFVFHAPPAGFGAIRLTVRSQWGFSYYGGGWAVSTAATFENLVGPAPVFLSEVSNMSPDGTRLVSEQEFSVAPGTEFTGVELSAQYVALITNPVTQILDPFNFTFSAHVYSFEALPDGILMTLEPILPNLTIARSPTEVVVAWPTNFSAWPLETTTQLGLTNGWSAATNIYTVSGTNFIISDTANEPRRYYRLKMP